MKQKIPRIMIAGTNSGCGKTTIVCGILSALKQLHVDSASCKCGPDYIDPMFHSLVFDIPSQNLDLFFTSKDQTRYLLVKNSKGKDITVMEGVMGFYDGMQMDSTLASSYELAKVTDTPVVLVVNCKGMALSVVPMIKGFLEFQKDHTIQGVILNGVSQMTGKQLKEMIEKQLPVKVYGCIPKLEEFSLASRHLGLVTPHELSDIRKDVKALGQVMQEYVDIKGLLQLAHRAPDLEDSVPKEWGEYLSSRPGQGLTLGIAFDPAFCFYYKDNLELLQALGCKITKFSPLKDKEIPKEVDGILLGGGYPEIYAKQLSENFSMRRDMKRRLEQGLFCMAECGGFMYLHDRMEDENGTMYPMAGVIEGSAGNQKKLVRFGYVQLEAVHENDYLKKGEKIRAHEFHYWDSTHNGEDFLAVKPSGKRQWNCMHAKDNLLAGYPHLYFYSNLKVPLRFLEKCRKYHNNLH